MKNLPEVLTALKQVEDAAFSLRMAKNTITLEDFDRLTKNLDKCLAGLRSEVEKL